jgi:hypothetical protein
MFGTNPLITSIYTADADCLVANNTFYIYCGRDEAAQGQQSFVMREWHILASTDMQNWTDLGAKMSLSTFSWANANAWAGSVCYKNGKYWWYVPVQQSSTGQMCIGVASSTSPTGPFTDAKGSPLITQSTPNCSDQFVIDPGVFVDDNGQVYIYWGGYWQLRACKLNDDMISLNGTPITPSGIPTDTQRRYWEAPTLRKYNGLYYLSYAAYQNPATIEYCTSNNPMGPWTYRGRILDTTTPTGTNHHSYAEYAGRWFCAYHTSPAGDDYHRRVCVDEMFYNSDGTIQKVVQTSNGPAPVSGNPTPDPTTVPGANLGDVNSSGTIDIVDALLVAQYYVDLVTSLNGCTQTPAPTGGGTIQVINFINGENGIESDIQGDTFEDILGIVNFSADDAVNLVKDKAPADAMLEDVISIDFKTDASLQAATVGYVVRYIKTIDGYEVRGTGSEIHLAFLVGPQYSIVGTSSYWPHTISEKTSTLSVQDALQRAAPVISAHIKGHSLVIENASQVLGCYSIGSGKTELVPAYAFTTTDGLVFVVDAVNGELVE